MSTMRAVGWEMKSRRAHKKLARVVALAAMLLGVGTLPSEATTIVTKEFNDTTLFRNFVFPPLEEFDEEIGGTIFRIEFADVHTTFTLSVENTVFDFPSNGLITVEGEEYDVNAILGDGFKCVQMTQAQKCLGYKVTGGSPSSPAALPLPGTDFTSPITVAINYGLFGWPDGDPDPIDIGRTDDFSTFMLFAKQGDPNIYEMVHFDKNAVASVITVGDHCDGANAVSFAKCFEFNQAALVPEPATVTGVVWGLFGLTVLSRRLKRRD